MKRILLHFRNQWMAMLALFLVLTGGTAYALDGSNTVFSDDIVNNEVKNADINNSSVTTNKLGDGSVTTLKIGQGAVTSDDVFDRGIGAVDLAEGAVGSFQLRNGGVEESDIAEGAVNSAKIGSNTITSADIDESQVSGLDRCPGEDTLDPIRGLCVEHFTIGRSWVDAADLCTNRGKRLASVSELRGILRALLAREEVGADHPFWADDLGESGRVAGFQVAYFVHGDGSIHNDNWNQGYLPLCVTEPNN